ncbi:MAG TPA: isochorismatase family cysteine hydrolase [Thermoanaerobaculales bacterium]|nr:isochorismatase family cysteine hydrolase [Thermoanaerobaculales bacterium]HPA79443.1 isochorismatase family cysteine hydrolase [Thermoanaerobaculales bacterium]HQL30816.1 isochorismatase family cysteine hydrolase [Thermoanaerobaculales bacterium]HQN97555.1 isochorismatase family cysteine hydrolase [Thermoanaerobaculales bacterium]HQP43267.1 isochorismatase family cysteine hydrolase [Thermoanaerobaculales bacterium]
MRRSMLLSLLVVTMLASAVLAADQPAAAKGKPALIVMDVQNAFMPYMDDEDTKMGLLMINATIEQFRAHGLPVIRVYHTDPDSGPLPGTEPFEFPATVGIRDTDPKVVKTHPSAFNATELDRLLREQGVDTVFLSGLSAVGCVLATYFDADRLEYRVFMVRDGVISHDAGLTASVEEMTGAVGYEAIAYMLDAVAD